MNIFETIKLAISSLLTNRLRSFLTMLGIIIGISAVITIATVGSSLKGFMADEFSEFATRTVEVIPMEGEYSSDDYIFSEESVEAFLKVNPGFMQIKSFSICFGDQTYLSYSGKDQNIGVTFEEYGSYLSQNFKILKGRGLTENDYDNSKSVGIIGKSEALKMFGSLDDAIGQKLTYSVAKDNINGTFYIVGVYNDDAYNGIYLPNARIADAYYSYLHSVIAAQNLDVDIDNYHSLSFYYDDTVDTEEASSIVNEFFSRYITDNKITLDVTSINDELEMALQELDVITIVVAFIAGIALLVAGVGVMNIMLVSVIERTKEIGVEKALGAKNSNIRFQFIIESIVICMVGCIIGILIGLFNCWVLAKVSSPIMYNAFDLDVSLKVVPSYVAIVISCIFCTLIGLFFGLYPANQAAKLNPIDALKYE